MDHAAEGIAKALAPKLVSGLLQTRDGDPLVRLEFRAQPHCASRFSVAEIEARFGYVTSGVDGTKPAEGKIVFGIHQPGIVQITVDGFTRVGAFLVGKHAEVEETALRNFKAEIDRARQYVRPDPSKVSAADRLEA